jgi:outer membrane protein assembly factor BamB
MVLNDLLLCGSVDGNLYSLDTRTGKLRWRFETKGPITGTPATNKDLIYFGSADNNFYALPL